MKLFRSALLAAALAAFSPAMAQAQNQNTGMVLLPHCKAFADERLSDSQFMQGVCVGSVQALFVFGRSLEEDIRFCRPKGSTIGQGIKVAVQYMDRNPSQLHLGFDILAAQAFLEAWPCPK
jgi:hypothetical protein